MATNGSKCISPEPIVKGNSNKNTEKELLKLQNGMLKNGLTNKLSFYQERLDVLGKFYSYLN